MPKETDINKQIIAAYARMGIVCWRNNSGKVRVGARFIAMAPAGTPDIIGYWPNGRFLGIENKCNGEPISHSQHDFIRSANVSGACVIIVTSLDDAVQFAMERRWDNRR